MCKTEFWMQAQELLAHPPAIKAVPWLAAHSGQLNMSPEAQAASAGPRAFWHCKPGDCYRAEALLCLHCNSRSDLPSQQKWSAQYQLNILICQGLIGIGACFARFWRKFWLLEKFHNLFLPCNRHRLFKKASDLDVSPRPCLLYPKCLYCIHETMLSPMWRIL